MAAARYWRLVGLSTAGGGDLELFALHWYSAGTRCDAAATLTSSHAPISGALATLQGTNPAQTVRFGAGAVRSGGFWLLWDFGAEVADPVPRIGAVARATFVGAAVIQRSIDGVAWVTDAAIDASIAYPGDGQYTADATATNARLSPTMVHAAVSVSGLDDVATGASGGYFNALAEPGVASGKVYFEAHATNASGSSVVAGIGVATAAASLGGSLIAYIGGDAEGVAYYNNDGKAYRSGSHVGTGSVSMFGPEDIIGVALDADARLLKFYKNGTLAWTVSSLPTGTLYPALSLYGGASARVNFGRSPFVYAPPAGHGPISARTLPQIDATSRVMRALALSCAASAPVTSASCRSAVTVRAAADVEFGGGGRVYGTTKAKGSPNTPVKSRVRLLRERDGLLAREVWSDPVTGAFEFAGVDMRTRWVVLAQDAGGMFWPVAASSFTVEAL